MYQKDYILRMLEMIAELVAAILGFIRNGKIEKATQTLENAYQDFLKEDAAFFRNIPKEKLTDKLLEEHNYTNGHLKILGELFLAEGELLSAKDKMEDSLSFYEKSLLLFEFTEKESNSFSLDKHAKITSIKEKIALLKN